MKPLRFEDQNPNEKFQQGIQQIQTLFSPANDFVTWFRYERSFYSHSEC